MNGGIFAISIDDHLVFTYIFFMDATNWNPEQTYLTSILMNFSLSRHAIRCENDARLKSNENGT